MNRATVSAEAELFPDFRHFVSGACVATFVVLGGALVQHALRASTALVVGGAALALALHARARGSGVWLAHAAVGVLVVAIVIPSGTHFGIAGAAWLLVAAGIARPLTGAIGGAGWAAVAATATAWKLVSMEPRPIGFTSGIGIALAALAVLIGYLFVAYFVSTRERSLARLAAEIQLRSAAEQESRQARIENEDLLARVTHDLRTPLAGIVGVSEVLERSGLSDEVAERIALIRGSAGSMLYAVHDLLDRSVFRKRELELREMRFDLAAALGECVELIRPLAREKGLALDLRSEGEISTRLLGDPVRVRQVLMNLLGNAVKFTRYGSVTVIVRELEVRRKRAGYRFEVRDTGPGFAGALTSQALEARAPGGAPLGGAVSTGLGLEICRSLIDAMGGEFGVESRPGRGSTFWFEVSFGLDDAGSFPELPSVETRVFSGELASPRAALLVEDDPVLSRVLAELLGFLGIPVQVCHTAEEAAAAYKPARHDLLLLDLNLPDRVGSELALDLRHRGAVAERQVIVGISADSRLGLPASEEALAFDEVLIKPISLDALREALAPYFTVIAPPTPTPNRGRERTRAVDPSWIQSLRSLESTTGKPLVEELVESFSRTAPLLVREMGERLAVSKVDAVGRAAHRLRGTSGNLGAVALMEWAARIEGAARDRDVKEIGAALLAGEALVQAAIEGLREVARSSREESAGEPERFG